MRGIASIAVAAMLLAAVGTAHASRATRPISAALIEPAGARSSGIGRDVYAGFLRAVHELHLAGAVVELAEGQDPVAEIARRATRRYDVIVVAIPVKDIRPIARAVAAASPRTRVLVPDYVASSSAPVPANVSGYVFRVEEPAYLAGFLASSLGAARPGRHIISAIGGKPIPTVDRFIAGYRAGAIRADPRVRVLVDYSYDFLAPRKCERLAIDQISRGARAVFAVAGPCGDGALRAALARRVPGVGVDVDQSSLGAGIVTSVVKHEGRALEAQLRAFVRGRSRAGTIASLGLGAGAVGLGPFGERVPAGLVRSLDRLRRELVRGTVRVRA